jgi:hypothetical protein
VPAHSADNVGVTYPLFLLTILASVVLAVAAARTILVCTLHLMHEGLPCTFHWRRVIFAAALFWFWYLAPAIAESRAATAMIRLVSIEQLSR